jgi:hypothetical protein
VSSNGAINKLIHLASLSMTKIGDGLVDPKLVLSWALNAAGAPQAAIGLLVPVRESLAMLPQIFEAAWLQGISRRKFVWAAGSAIQGLSVAGMALVCRRWKVLCRLVGCWPYRSLCAWGGRWHRSATRTYLAALLRKGHAAALQDMQVLLLLLLCCSLGPASVSG